MIQVNELRLGSLIHFPYLGSNVEVIGIALKDDARLFIQTKLNNNSFFELPEKYKPIELTEEMLLNCGFNKHINQATLFTLNDVDIWFVNGKFCNILDIELKYYHQLQNYYYSQRLEELKING